MLGSYGYPDAVLGFHGFSEPFDGGLNADFIEDRRADFKGQRARFLDDGIDGRLDLLHVLFDTA